ncbi:MAG: DUF4340 domain-containing protein, partial [Nitrospinota bacterium]|nr:DUF4340 domain-containing protein [Nitrospinota bacterium]
LKDPKAKLSFWQSGDSDVTVSISIGDRNPEKRGYYVTMSDRNNVFLLEEDIINSIPREASDLRSRHVFFLDSLKFSRIEIHRPGSLVTLVKDKNQEWHRDNMAGESLDYNMVKEFLDSLSSIKIRDFVADNPISLREYGLDPPSAQILLYKEEGGAPLYLSLGLKSPAGYLFAQSGSEKSVIALDAGVQGILNFFL